MKKTANLILLAFLTPVVAACGASEQASPAAPAKSGAGTIPAHQSVTPINDFVNGVTDTTDESQQHAVRIYNAIAECMRSKGWDYPTYVPDTKTDSQREPSDPNALLAWRKKNGYGLLAMPPPSTPSQFKNAINRQYQYQQGLSVDARTRYQAAEGVGEGDTSGRQPSGCRGEAAKKVNANTASGNEALLREITDLQKGVQADPAYIQAAAQWSSCMQGKGFQYRTPDEARKSISDLLPKQTGPDANAAAREIQVATADAECSVDTIWPVQERLETAIVQQMVDKYGASVTCGAKCE